MIATADGQGLLRAIIDEPGADDLRLMYADWLEENGQGERAEFIRVQVLEERYFQPTYNEAAGSDSRAARLLRRFGHNWLGKHYEAGWGRNCSWSRGFISTARLPLDAWLRHGPAMVRQHPLEWVEVACRQPWYCDATATYTWTICPKHIPFHQNKIWGGGLPAYFVPYEVGVLLPRRQGNDTYVMYDESEPDAPMADLSQALIAWAKSQPA